MFLLRLMAGADETKVVAGRPAANASVSSTPRILTLGGDHTTTLSALRSTHEKWGPVSVIHFDSHIGRVHGVPGLSNLLTDDVDTWDPSVLGESTTPWQVSFWLNTDCFQAVISLTTRTPSSKNSNPGRDLPQNRALNHGTFLHIAHEEVSTSRISSHHRLTPAAAPHPQLVRPRRHPRPHYSSQRRPP